MIKVLTEDMLDAGTGNAKGLLAVRVGAKQIAAAPDFADVATVFKQGHHDGTVSAGAVQVYQDDRTALDGLTACIHAVTQYLIPGSPPGAQNTPIYPNIVKKLGILVRASPYKPGNVH